MKHIFLLLSLFISSSFYAMEQSGLTHYHRLQDCPLAQSLATELREANISFTPNVEHFMKKAQQLDTECQNHSTAEKATCMRALVDAFTEVRTFLSFTLTDVLTIPYRDYSAQRVLKMQFNPRNDSQLSVMCPQYNLTYILNRRSEGEATRIEIEQDHGAMTYTADGSSIALGSNHITLYDTSSGKFILAFGRTSKVYDCIIDLVANPADNTLISGRVLGQISIWAPRTGELLWSLDGDDLPLLTCNPQGTQLALLTRKNLTLIDLTNRTKTRQEATNASLSIL